MSKQRWQDLIMKSSGWRKLNLLNSITKYEHKRWGATRTNFRVRFPGSHLFPSLLSHEPYIPVCHFGEPHAIWIALEVQPTCCLVQYIRQIASGKDRLFQYYTLHPWGSHHQRTGLFHQPKNSSTYNQQVIWTNDLLPWTEFHLLCSQHIHPQTQSLP